MIKIHKAEFIMGTDKPFSFPELSSPEIAFVGRSNVGKSSLINSLVHRKNLARISSTPGKTSEINFFNVEDTWTLVDMPGFGFTKRGVKKREDWFKLNFSYLDNRDNLKLVCVLIDSRHDPMEIDLSLIEHFENTQRNYLIILTKCDKLKEKQVIERKDQLDNLIKQCSFALEVLPYSSITDIGRKELMAIVKKYAG
jgi:GTP-binding protein